MGDILMEDIIKLLGVSKEEDVLPAITELLKSRDAVFTMFPNNSMVVRELTFGNILALRDLIANLVDSLKDYKMVGT